MSTGEPLEGSGQAPTSKDTTQGEKDAKILNFDRKLHEAGIAVLKAHNVEKGSVKAFNDLAEGKIRPGRENLPLPAKYGDEYYDPLVPPTEVKTGDKIEYRGGRKLDQRQVDKMYAERFWARIKSGREDQLSEMIGQAQAAVSENNGFLVLHLEDPKYPTQFDRERMSAYRLAAELNGYTTMSNFRIADEKDKTVAILIKRSGEGKEAASTDKPEHEATMPPNNGAVPVETSGAKEQERKSDLPFTEEEVAVLKAIHEKCTQEFPGEKYTTALFGVHVNLTEAETDLVGKLVQEASRDHAKFVAQTPKYATFQSLLEERRNRVGPLFESKFVEEDPSYTEPRIMDKPGKGLIIVVPTNIFRLYSWEKKIGSLDNGLHDYKKGIADKQMSKHFGLGVRDLYSFVKQSRTQNTQPRQN